MKAADCRFAGSRRSAAYRTSGRRIEVVALATPEALSRLGIPDRFLAAATEKYADLQARPWHADLACLAEFIPGLRTG